MGAARHARELRYLYNVIINAHTSNYQWSKYKAERTGAALRHLFFAPVKIRGGIRNI